MGRGVDSLCVGGNVTKGSLSGWRAGISSVVCLFYFFMLVNYSTDSAYVLCWINDSLARAGGHAPDYRHAATEK